MMTHKLISADSHIVEPPDLYTKRIEPRFRDRAPRLERLETPAGRKFDAWVIDGQSAGIGSGLRVICDTEVGKTSFAGGFCHLL